MNTVTIGNASGGPLAFLQFSTIANGATKTRSLFTIDLDPFRGDLDAVSAIGGYVAIDGTAAAGSQTVTAGVTLANATRAARVDTTAGPFTVVMMPLAAVALGTIVSILFAVDNGNLTLDGNGAETIDGNPTLVLTDVGVKRLKKTSTGWVSV